MNSDSRSGRYSIIRFNLLTSLLAILNTNDESDTDFVIAKYILNNLNTMADTSIYKVAEDCFVSRSSVQRFIANIGYDSFTQMKQSIAEVVAHEGALLDYTDHSEYTNYLLESIRSMSEDIAEAASGDSFRKLLDMFAKADNIVILTAEDSAHACRLLQQQLLAFGKLIRIVTSAAKDLSLLNSLTENDLLMVCSITGNFALAANDQLPGIKAKKCLITLNRTAVFEDHYSLIFYLSDKIRPSSRNISMFKNVYTSYGLTFLFDLFYHECYLRYQAQKEQITQ